MVRQAGPSPTMAFAQTHPHDSIRPSRVFERYLWTNPEVCNECFSRCRRTYRDQRDGWGHVVETSERTEHAELGYDVEEIDAHGASRIYRPRTTCRECGSVGLLAQSDVLSKRDALGRVSTLVERLAEQDIPCNEPAVRAVVREAHSRPNLDGQDREIFERAVEFGVRKARATP